MERRQVVMLAALGLILLGLVYAMFFRGGSEETSQPPVPESASLAQTGDDDPFEPEDKPGKDAADQPVETFEVFASRDPFEPVVGRGDEEGPSGDDPGADPGSNEDDAGSDGSNEDPGQTDPGETEPAAQEDDDGVQGHAVELIDVFRKGGKDKAQVQVDSTGYTVKPGDIFAENFQLVSTSNRCATMLFGDDQFTLCEGEQILK